MVADDLLVLSWQGDRGREVRMRLAVGEGRPVIRDLAIRSTATPWAVLGENLAPEYHVVTGVRRMTTQQADPLESRRHRDHRRRHRQEPLVCLLGRPARDPERRRRRGGSGASRVLGGPRTASDIRRADASFSASSCRVKTDGAALEVTFPGLTMGIFAGDLRFTAYRGTNLLRMDAVAKTNEEWIAYKYDAGLERFSTALTPRVIWRDTGGQPQQYAFGGVVNQTMVPVKARTACSSPRAKADRWRRSRRRTPSSSRARSTPTSATSGTARIGDGQFGVRHPPGRARGGAAVRRQLRAVQRPARHRAADGRVLLRRAPIAQRRPARRCWPSRTATSSSRCPATRRS